MLNTKLRKLARTNWDSLFCSKKYNKLTLGTAGDNWTIVDNGMMQTIYSGGVGQDISFELDLVKNFNSNVYLFDPSPTGKLTIEKFASMKNFKFSDYGLSKNDGYEKFYTPKDMLEGSFTIDPSAGSVEFTQFRVRRLSNLVKENNHFSIDVLKLDIEGSEYCVLDDILESDVVCRQICVEFHHFFKNGSRLRTLSTIFKLYLNGYIIVHKTGSDYTFLKTKNN
jgi:FkbM family methyltransferase